MVLKATSDVNPAFHNACSDVMNHMTGSDSVPLRFDYDSSNSSPHAAEYRVKRTKCETSDQQRSLSMPTTENGRQILMDKRYKQQDHVKNPEQNVECPETGRKGSLWGQDTKDRTMVALNLLEEENTTLTRDVMSLLPQLSSLVQAKERLRLEMKGVRDSLEVMASHSQLLEDERTRDSRELDTLRAVNQSLLKRIEALTCENKQLMTSNMELSRQTTSLTVGVQTLTKEEKEHAEQLASLRASQEELKTRLAAVTADSKRYVLENSLLKTQISATNQEKNAITKVTSENDQKVTELATELKLVQQELDRTTGENKRLMDELATVTKSSEALSAEVGEGRVQLERLSGDRLSLEQAHTMALKQRQLHANELTSLEQQLVRCHKNLQDVQKDRLSDKNHHEDILAKVKDEMRQVKIERDNLQVKAEELEQSLKQRAHVEKDRCDTSDREVELWRTKCEKLRASLEESEAEVQSLTHKMEEQEDEIDVLKMRLPDEKCEEEKRKREENLQRDLKCKQRQIEILEEQLREATLRKIRRASVEHT